MKKLFNSEVLSKALASNGWSQQKLADQMNDVAYKSGDEETKIRPSNVSSWVHGSDISGTYLYLLAKVLEIPMEDFFVSIKQKEGIPA